MGKKYTNKILTTEGFTFANGLPADDRTVVEYFTDLSQLVQNNFAYEGMQVYVISDNKTDKKPINKTYEYNNGVWTALSYAHEHPYLPDDTVYAKGVTQGGAAVSANKVNKSLKIKVNGTEMINFDGSTAQDLDIISQNAFSKIMVGDTTVEADQASDTIELSGENITITPETNNDKITFSVADGSTTEKGIVKLIDSVNSTSTDTAATPNSVKQAYDKANHEHNLVTVTLDDDLYTYTPIGKAQKANNEVIGATGDNISNTNRGKLGAAGDTLKSVFEKIFGTQQDQQPTITTSYVILNADAGTTSYGGGEYGTAVAATDVTITFTLVNYGTANYGYRCGDVKTTGNQTFYYPVTKQNSADLVITLPSGKTASSGMVTAGTCVSANTNLLYCNFNSNKQVSIKINLPAGNVSTSSQTRYGQISASVALGAAQKENQLTAGTTITKFLTYLGNDATDTAALSGGTKTDTAGAYTISAGTYSPYYLASTASELGSVNKNVATKYSSGAVSITCSTDSYIWFLLPPGTSGAKTIQYEALGQWYDFDGGTSGPTNVSLTLNSGATATYKAYRTNKKAAAGTTQFKIV